MPRDLRAVEVVAGTCRRSLSLYEWQGRGMRLAATLDQAADARQGAIYGMRMTG